jgi:transcription initiation factor TFIID subunit 13
MASPGVALQEPASVEDTVAPASTETTAADGEAARRGRKAPEGRFQRELRQMMYGFGDDREPLTESVQLMEELVVDYVHSVLNQAQQAAEQRQRGSSHGGAGTARVKERDLIFALRRDRRRQERIEELLEVWKEVKAVRSQNSGEVDRD